MRPWVLCPAGPLAWASHEQIMPVLREVWRDQGFRLESLHFPRPRITRAWVRELKQEASALILPLGAGHYDLLWTVGELRSKHGVDIPVIAMAASDFTKGFHTFLDHTRSIRPGDRLIVNCAVEADLARAALRGTLPVTVIPLPIRVEFRPHPRESRQSRKRRLGFRPDDFLVVYAGRLSVQKNLHGLLAVFSAFRQRHPRAKLVVLGGCDPVRLPHLKVSYWGRYLHEIGLLITRLRLEDSVVFPGTVGQAELSDYFGACDAHVSLTLHSGEDFGYSIAQGLLCGAPTIVTRWGGGHDFVRAGAALGVRVFSTDNGVRADLREALARLEQLYRECPSRARRAAVRRYARSVLSPASVGKRWSRAVTETLATPARAFPEIQIDRRVRRAYRLHQYQVHCDPIAPFQFTSAKDPLYRRICRIYAGAPDPARGSANSGKFYLHPLYDPRNGYLDDPIAPRQRIRLCSSEARRALRRASLRQGLRARQTAWFQRLVRMGVLLPASRPDPQVK